MTLIMKINTKIRYGLRAIIAISQCTNGILQKEIAEQQNIPLSYLDSIISGLRNAGLIVNVSGKSSGYILAKDSVKISTYDIYRAFEPELLLVNCSCASNECKRINICPTKDFWFELNTEIKKVMKSKTIDILVEEQNELLTKQV